MNDVLTYIILAFVFGFSTGIAFILSIALVVWYRLIREVQAQQTGRWFAEAYKVRYAKRS